MGKKLAIPSTTEVYGILISQCGKYKSCSLHKQKDNLQNYVCLVSFWLENLSSTLEETDIKLGCLMTPAENTEQEREEITVFYALRNLMTSILHLVLLQSLNEKGLESAEHKRKS